MRACYIALLAAANLCAFSDAVLAVGDIKPVTLEEANGMLPISNNVKAGRSLRARETDDDDTYEEERGGPNSEIDSWVARLIGLKAKRADADELPSHLDLDQVLDKLTKKKEKVFKSLEKDGITPEIMAKRLGIKEKLKTKTPEELEADDNYQMYTFFKNHWDNTHEGK